MSDVDKFKKLNDELTSKRVMCVEMKDDKPVESGTQGTITGVDDIGTIQVKWDNGRTLGLIPNEDEYIIIKQ